MPDAIVGARYQDHTNGKKFRIVGIYERSVRGEYGEIKDNEIIVDALYDGHDDPVRIEVGNFRTDESIEVIEVPDRLEGYQKD